MRTNHPVRDGVYFEGNFWGHPKGQRRGRPLTVGAELLWEGRLWRVPAVYVCGGGLVADFCVRADTARVRAFWEKHARPAADGAELDEAGQAALERENPLSLRAHPQAVWNGRDLRLQHSCSCVWNPVAPEDDGEDPTARALLEHYGCDPACGWVFLRAAFAWTMARHGRPDTLSFLLEPEPEVFFGPAFSVDGPGQTVVIRHPVTGGEFQLTVEDYAPDQRLDSLPEDAFFYPSCYTALIYTLCPEQPDGVFQLQDADPGDPPRPRVPDRFLPSACNGLILCVRTDRENPSQHGAASALRFSPGHRVRWRPRFTLTTRSSAQMECRLSHLR